MNKKRGFTLTEVLITLGVIGVVSALTVPTLMNNYQTKALALQIRKVVLDFENQVDMLITEEGKTSLAATSIKTDDGLDAFIQTHFKVLKRCDSSNTSECFANQDYIAISGNDTKSFSCKGTSYVLANSAAICARVATTKNVKLKNNASASATPSVGWAVSAPGTSASYYQFASGLNIELYIDSNGQEGPNIGGRDMFHVYMKPDGRIYGDMNVDSNVCKTDGDSFTCVSPDNSVIEQDDCQTSPLGDGCIDVLEQNNWVMNY